MCTMCKLAHDQLTKNRRIIRNVTSREFESSIMRSHRRSKRGLCCITSLSLAIQISSLRGGLWRLGLMMGLASVASRIRIIAV